MSKPVVDKDECIGCGLCVADCPMDVLEVKDDVACAVNADACIGCKICERECPMSAIEVVDTDEDAGKGEPAK